MVINVKINNKVLSKKKYTTTFFPITIPILSRSLNSNNYKNNRKETKKNSVADSNSSNLEKLDLPREDSRHLFFELPLHQGSYRIPEALFFLFFFLALKSRERAGIGKHPGT